MRRESLCPCPKSATWNANEESELLKSSSDRLGRDSNKLTNSISTRPRRIPIKQLNRKAVESLKQDKTIFWFIFSESVERVITPEPWRCLGDRWRPHRPEKLAQNQAEAVRANPRSNFHDKDSCVELQRTDKGRTTMRHVNLSYEFCPILNFYLLRLRSQDDLRQIFEL